MDRIKLQIVPVTNAQGQWFCVREDVREGERRYICGDYSFCKPGDELQNLRDALRYSSTMNASPVKFKRFQEAVNAAQRMFGRSFEITPWEAG